MVAGRPANTLGESHHVEWESATTQRVMVVITITRWRAARTSGQACGLIV